MISCYDQRPIGQIIDVLMSAPQEKINLINVCIVLCDHIAALEAKIENEQANATDSEGRDICDDDHTCLINGRIVEING